MSIFEEYGAFKGRSAEDRGFTQFARAFHLKYCQKLLLEKNCIFFKSHTYSRPILELCAQ